MYSYPLFNSSSVVNLSISLLIVVPFGVNNGSPCPSSSFTIYRSRSRPSSTLPFRSFSPRGACIFTLDSFFSMNARSLSASSGSSFFMY